MKIDVREGLSFEKLDEALNKAKNRAIYNEDKIHYIVMDQKTFEEYGKMTEKLPSLGIGVIPSFSYSGKASVYQGYPIAIFNGLRYGEVDIV